MPTLPLRTVYETLRLFVELGLVHRLDTGTGAIRYDTNLAIHAHVICPDCHELREATVDPDQLGQALHEQCLERVEIIVRRQCPSCSAKGTTSPT